MATTVRAVRTVFAKRGRATTFVALALATFLLFIWLPVKLTPGNDFLFQLSIMRWSDFVLFGMLSLLNALLMLMQWHLHKTQQDAKAGFATVAVSGAGECRRSLHPCSAPHRVPRVWRASLDSLEAEACCFSLSMVG